MIGRLKKKARHDKSNRDFAIVYIDGEVIEAETHALCIDDYLNKKFNEHLDYSLNTRPDLEYIDNIDDKNSDFLYPKEKEDLRKIRDNIKQIGFAHGVNNTIYVEQNTLFNVDINTVINAIKNKYPNFDIYNDETNEKLARLKKKAWLSERDNNRKFAILYADGKIYTGYTHAECAEEYKKEFNAFDIKNGAFAYMGNDNNIYLADDFLYGYTKNDLPQIAQDLKQKYPNSNIYYDSTSHFDTDLSEQHEQVARLKRVAEDSCNVEPNGVLWNDNLWDTYDNSLVNKQKSNINREWLFEQPIDNQEWNLQEN